MNSFLSANGLTLTQQQFDALASLQFNCSAVLSGCRVTRLLTGGDYTEVSMANAWCSWVSVGGSYSSKMLERRIRELQVYFYGDYTGNESDPGFRYLVHMPNGGSLEDNRVLCYPRGETYAALQTATRSGMYFAGWYTAASGGAHITNSTPAAENLIVYAHWSSTPVENPNEDNGGSGEDPVTLKTSEACIQFIKDHEGFSKFAYWDYGQWTIGYGTRCEENEFPDGITEEEADQRLRLMLVDFEKMVDDVLDASPLVHTQSQYDAMISFTFNLGPQWINPKYNIYQYFVYGGYTEMEFVNTMGRWLSSSSEVVDGLAKRRIDEADMYLNGVYRLGSTAYVRVVFNAMAARPRRTMFIIRRADRLARCRMLIAPATILWAGMTAPSRAAPAIRPKRLPPRAATSRSTPAGRPPACRIRIFPAMRGILRPCLRQRTAACSKARARRPSSRRAR